MMILVTGLAACSGEPSVSGDLSADDLRRIKSVTAQITDSPVTAIAAKADHVSVTTRDGKTFTLRKFEGRWMQSEESGSTIFD